MRREALVYAAVMGTVFYLASGCARAIGECDPETVHQTYGLTYSEQSRRIFATALFQDGSDRGEAIRLQRWSRVLLDGFELGWQPYPGIRYEATWGQDLKSSYVFEWQDPDGRSYRNFARIVPFQVLSVSPRVSTRGVITVQLGGPAMESSDIWAVWIDQGGWGAEKSAHLTPQITGPGELSIRLWSPENWQAMTRLRPGFARLRVLRGRRDQLQDATPGAGGVIQTLYESRHHDIEIVDE